MLASATGSFDRSVRIDSTVSSAPPPTQTTAAKTCSILYSWNEDGAAHPKTTMPTSRPRPASGVTSDDDVGAVLVRSMSPLRFDGSAPVDRNRSAGCQAREPETLELDDRGARAAGAEPRRPIEPVMNGDVAHAERSQLDLRRLAAVETRELSRRDVGYERRERRVAPGTLAAKLHVVGHVDAPVVEVRREHRELEQATRQRGPDGGVRDVVGVGRRPPVGPHVEIDRDRRHRDRHQQRRPSPLYGEGDERRD